MRADNQSSMLCSLKNQSNVKELQAYIKEVVKIRGFGDEKPSDIMLLLVEEVGELAKALRKHVGIKVDAERSAKYSHVSEELADVFFYLLDLSNELNVDLFEALKSKELENIKRNWE